MYPRSSSIFSSRGQTRLHAVLATGGWTLLALAAIDIALGLSFAMPHDNRDPGGGVARYLDYGRTIEGKLTRMLGRTPAEVAPIVNAGWIEDCRPLPSRGGISLYGMSFTNNIGATLRAIDPATQPALYSGPEAPPNHSFACFDHVQALGGDGNRVQVIGVLASAMGRMHTLGGLSTSFEAPQPFTFPRYRVGEDGRLRAIWPLIRTPTQLRDPARRAAFYDQMAREDMYFDRWLIGPSLADHSTFLRLIRRAWGQAVRRRIGVTMVSDAHDFRLEYRPELDAILADFAAKVRAKGGLPIVLLLQDRGTGIDTLYRLAAPGLHRNGIAFVSSHAIAPVDDPTNFLPDGHFTPAVDRRIAQALLDIVRKSGNRPISGRTASRSRHGPA